MGDILETARRVIALAEKADNVLAEYNGQTWGVPDEAGPGEIAQVARFAILVDAVLTECRCYTWPLPTEADAIGNSMIDVIRARLGLPATPKET